MRRVEVPRLDPVWWAAPLAVVGGAGFAAVFTVPSLVVPLVVAAVVGVAVTLPVPRVADLPPAVRVGAGALIVVAAAAVALRCSPLVVLEGLRHGPRAILAASVPAPPDPRLRAVPVLLTAGAAAYGAVLWARPSSKVRLVGALPSLVVLVAGLSFGGRHGLARAGWVAPGWAVTVLVALAASARSGGAVTSGWRTSRGVGRAVMAVVVLVVAVPLGGWLPSRDDGARVLLPRPGEATDLRAQPNPLARVSALRSGGQKALFVAETSAPVARWRLAVLDLYDGDRWQSSAAYHRTGRQLPEVDEETAAPGSSTRVEQTVELLVPDGAQPGDDPLWGRWLPVADRVTELSVPDVALFDAGGGTALVAPDRAVPGTYQAVSRMDEPDAERLVHAEAADDAEARRALAVPDPVPAPLEAFAQQALATAAADPRTGPDYAVAAAIQERLVSEGFQLISSDAPSGHTLEHLRRFVDSARPGVTARGSVEQFVATFAVVARLAGLPSRVVVGFRGAGVPGRQAVGTRDATAWVEVKFEDVGWVVFDPVPELSTDEPAPPQPVVVPEDARATPTTLPEAGADSASDGEQAGDGARARFAVAQRWAGRGALALLPLLLVALAVPVVARRWRGQRRRRAPDARARVVGSWLTAVDDLRAAGLEIGRTDAVADVVAAARRRFGEVALPLVPLGTLANHSRFADAAIPEAQAERAWELCDAFTAARRQGRQPSQLVRESLRSFRVPRRVSVWVASHRAG